MNNKMTWRHYDQFSILMNVRSSFRFSHSNKFLLEHSVESFMFVLCMTQEKLFRKSEIIDEEAVLSPAESVVHQFGKILKRMKMDKYLESFREMMAAIWTRSSMSTMNSFKISSRSTIPFYAGNSGKCREDRRRNECVQEDRSRMNVRLLANS